MVGRADRAKLFNNDKKIQKAISELDSLSVDDINKIRVPFWMRQKLIEIKEGKIDKTLITKPELLKKILETSKPRVDDLSYKVYRYVGRTQIVDNVEVFENELVLCVNDKEIKVAHTYVDISKFGDTLQFINTVKNYDEFNAMKSDDTWQRLMPNESREETDNSAGFSIRRIQ